MSLIFGALIAVNVYFFFLRGRTSLPDLIRTSEKGKQVGPSAAITPAGAPAPVAPKPKPAGDEEDARVVEGVMKETDTVERAWKTAGLAARDVNELAGALSKVFDLHTVRAGHAWTLRFDAEDHLRALDYRTTPALAYRVERAPEAPGGGAGWKATRDENRSRPAWPRSAA